MFDYAYLIELLTPVRSGPDLAEDKKSVFVERYRRILASGCGVSVPDNPMGKPRYALLDMIQGSGLPVDTEKIVMNLNTFHAKDNLDGLLETAARTGIRYLLVIRGDGGPALPRLDPQSIGGKLSVATSIDLLGYINRTYAGTFVTGAAFNPYNATTFETNRLKQKMDAGAQFVITQPLIGKNAVIDRLMDLPISTVIEAWMSKNVDLLFKSVRVQKAANAEAYDPVKNLKRLHAAYPSACVYLSMLSFKQDWKAVLPRI